MCSRLPVKNPPAYTPPNSLFPSFPTEKKGPLFVLPSWRYRFLEIPTRFLRVRFSAQPFLHPPSFSLSGDWLPSWCAARGPPKIRSPNPDLPPPLALRPFFPLPNSLKNHNAQSETFIPLSSLRHPFLSHSYFDESTDRFPFLLPPPFPPPLFSC